MIIKRFFYKILLGEIFISQYKKDSRSYLARVIDIFIPICTLNFFLFLILFPIINSFFFTFATCILVTILLFRSIKLLKSFLKQQFQGIIDLKEQVIKLHLYLSSLDKEKLESYALELLHTISKQPSVQHDFSSVKQNIMIKVIDNKNTVKDELEIVNNFKNELLSSNKYKGIVILNYPASKKLLKLAKSYKDKSIITFEIIDIFGLINLALTYEYNLNSIMINSSKEELEPSLNFINEQLLFYKKKTFSHTAVAILLLIIGSILDSFGGIYIILSLVNILLGFISFYKYLNTINFFLPGLIDAKIYHIYKG